MLGTSKWTMESLSYPRPYEHISFGEKMAETQDFRTEMVLGPPTSIAPHMPIGLPIVVALKNIGGRHHYQIQQDTSSLWAFASLVTEDSCRTIAPPRTDLLLGESVSAIRQGYYNIADGTIGYAMFPGLSFGAPGKYRLRVNVVDMKR